ncbi:MAG: MarR family transcriptional regulator [Acidimicrobiales bacterium]
MTPSRSASRTAVDTSDVAARLRLSATRLARRLRQEASSGHTPTQLSALAAIHNHGPLTLGALAELERVAPPSITKVITKLEAEGVVARTTDPTDGRVSLVSTTKAGRDLIAESRRRKTTWLTARIGRLPLDDQARIADALDALDHLLDLDDRP